MVAHNRSVEGRPVRSIANGGVGAIDAAFLEEAVGDPHGCQLCFTPAKRRPGIFDAHGIDSFLDVQAKNGSQW